MGGSGAKGLCSNKGKTVVTCSVAAVAAGKRGEKIPLSICYFYRVRRQRILLSDMLNLLVFGAVLGLLATSVAGQDSSSVLFSFSQGWPGLTCLINSCNVTQQPINGFLIHGLWLDYTDGKFPQFCTTEAFDYNAIRSLSNDLTGYWPSLYNSPTFLWSHEWSKHGTCAVQTGVFDSEFDFFQGVLNLRKKMDLLGSLTAAGIVPDDHKQVQRAAIKKAVEVGLDLPPNAVQLECYWDKQEEVQYLSEIRLCISATKDLSFCSFPPAYQADASCRESTVVFANYRW